MRLQIRHRTSYKYESPVPYGLQQLRLTPVSGAGQIVTDWEIEVTGGQAQLEYRDHHTNHVSLTGITPGSSHIDVLSHGIVETTDTSGVVGSHSGLAPLWLYLRTTPQTAPHERVRQLQEGLERDGSTNDLPLLHRLSDRILEAVDYRQGTTDAASSAEEVLEAGSGVCQDHAHVFISAARDMGFPVRYVSGYLLMEDRTEQAASHAWVEAWIDDLGWVGFDVSNAISPDERYVRLAVGLDYRDAAPISGIRFGGGPERLDVSLNVQQQQ